MGLLSRRIGNLSRRGKSPKSNPCCLAGSHGWLRLELVAQTNH